MMVGMMNQVMQKLEETYEHPVSLHNPKKRHAILSRRNNDIANTFLGFDLACRRAIPEKKRREKVTIKPV